MNAEKEFHRKRRAFVLFKKTGILLAEEGFSGSHVQLLVQSGFSEQQAGEIISSQPRGFALNGNITFYQGENFLELTPQNQDYALTFLPLFRSLGMLSEKGRVYSGVSIGKPGESWTPLKEI